MLRRSNTKDKSHNKNSKLSNTDIKSLKGLCSTNNKAVILCFANALTTLQQQGIERSFISNEFMKEFKILFSFVKKQNYSQEIVLSTLKALKWLVAIESSMPFFEKSNAILFLTKTISNKLCIRTSLEIILKMGSYSKYKESLCIKIASLHDFFGQLVSILAKYIDDHLSKGKELPLYDCTLILDALTLVLNGAPHCNVFPILSYEPLVDLIKIYPGFDRIGLQVAHLIELIAKLTSRSIQVHFRTDNMLDRFYNMLNDCNILNAIKSTTEEPCFNIFAAFISILQYNVKDSFLTENAVERKYFDTFIQLSKHEELHWIIQKPWTGGTVILQKLFTTHWQHFNHLLPIIDHNNLTFGEKLGAGNFGTVYRGIWKRPLESVIVAIKVVNTDTENFDVKELRRELMLLYFLKHPSLMDFYGGCYDKEKNCFYLITRLYNTNLRALLSSRDVTKNEKGTLAIQIALGIKHLHDIGIAHRDLKCENILVCTDPLSACIGDFGIARALGSGDRTAKGGTWRYMSPEWIASLYGSNEKNKYLCIERTCRGETSFDVYSFGHILWALWKQKEPLQDVSDVTIISKACNGLIPVLPPIDDAPGPWKRLFEGCWASQMNRFTIEQVIDLLRLNFANINEGNEMLSRSEDLLNSKQRRISQEDARPPSTLNTEDSKTMYHLPIKRVPTNDVEPKDESADFIRRIVTLEASLKSCQIENKNLQQTIKKNQIILEKQANEIILACENSINEFKDKIQLTFRKEAPTT